MAMGSRPTVSRAPRVEPPNGQGIAAILAAGVGAFALGLLVLLNEAGIYAAPALYGPAGGISGRTTMATVAWLAAWGVLHYRWKAREIDGRRIFVAAMILIAIGVVATFPPLWRVL